MLRRFVGNQRQLKLLLTDPQLVLSGKSFATQPGGSCACPGVVLNRSALFKDTGVIGWGSLLKNSRSRFRAVSQQASEKVDTETDGPKSTKWYTKKMNRFILSGTASRAMEVFEEMKSEKIPHDVKSYTAFMKAISRSGDVDAVSKLFKEMQDAGIEPDKFAYNTYIYTFSKSGDLSSALDILEQMQAKGLEKDVVTCRSMMAICAKAKDLEKAKAFFEEVIEKHKDVDIRNYNGLLEVYAEVVDHSTAASYLHEALELLEKAKQQELAPNVMTYVHLSKLCGKGGLREEAKTYLSAMKTSGPAKRLILYDMMMEAISEMELSDTELTTELMAVFKTMKENGLKPSSVTFDTLIKLYDDRGDVRQALDFLEALEKEGIGKNGSGFGARLICIERMGRDNVAPADVLKMANEELEKRKGAGVHLSFGGHKTWLTLCDRASDIESASECWKEFTADRRKADGEMMEMMMGLNLRHDKTEEALKLFDYVKENDLKATPKMLQMMIDHLVEHQDSENASQLQTKIQKLNLKLDEDLESKLQSI